MTETLSSTSIM